MAVIVKSIMAIVLFAFRYSIFYNVFYSKNEDYIMLTNQQKRDVENLLKNTAEKCIKPFFKNLNDSDISFKTSKLDPVSIADKQAESLLHTGLLSILPKSFFIGEELFADRPEILNFLNQKDKPVWIVDPIDGTDNFISGQAGFGIMVCLFFSGEIVASLFYEICSNQLTTYYKGSQITINGKSAITKTRITRPFIGHIGKKLYRFPEIQNIKKITGDINISSADSPSIITYHQLLTGKIDFLIFKVTYPWDHLPGIAIVTQNGAISTRWDGSPFQFSDISTGLVVARNKEILDTVLEKIITPLSQSQAILEMNSFKTANSIALHYLQKY